MSDAKERDPGTLLLDSGRNINLLALNQYGTYSGLLEGFPTVALNAQIVGQLMQPAAPFRGTHAARVLIDPPRRPYYRDLAEREMFLQWNRDIGVEGPEHDPEWLPKITCIGAFRSYDAIREFSRLTIVWFQDRFALPINDAVLRAIAALDWDALAQEYMP